MNQVKRRTNVLRGKKFAENESGKKWFGKFEETFSFVLSVAKQYFTFS